MECDSSRAASVRTVVGFAAFTCLSLFCIRCSQPEIELIEHEETALPLTTTSALTKRYFSQGIAALYAFDFDAALRSFNESLSHDPRCSLAWWGVALATGPNINHPTVDREALRESWHATQMALETSEDASPLEQALIQSLAERYALSDSHELLFTNSEYSASMKATWLAFPCPDVGCVFAESIMMRSPRDYWTLKGEPREGTTEALDVLESVLVMAPAHKGASHLYIHALEASPNPARALEAAEFLGENGAPWGHLLHMPAHIYVRLGDYSRAEASSLQAVSADYGRSRHLGDSPRFAIYRAHNYHLLAFVAMMQGRAEVALEAADDLMRVLTPKMLDGQPLWAEFFVPLRWHVLVRFGMWQEILEERPPAVELRIARAMWHYSRCIALANTRDFNGANVERERFDETVSTIDGTTVMRRSRVEDLLAIARHMLMGELLVKMGEVKAGLEQLRRGILIEDRLAVTEPPNWPHPLRHAYGALLLEQGRVAEAVKVYREDLRRHPENGWALHGLAECEKRLGNMDSWKDALERFMEAWEGAQVAIQASCFCRSKAERGSKAYELCADSD